MLLSIYVMSRFYRYSQWVFCRIKMTSIFISDAGHFCSPRRYLHRQPFADAELFGEQTLLLAVG